MKILVVDNDRVHAIQTRRLLELHGQEVSIAESSKDAWQQLRSQQFSMVISVWQTPEIHGLELARRIHANLAVHIPYIILTTTVETLEDRKNGFECGVDDYLTRPIDANELYSRMCVAERMISAKSSIGSEVGELARVKAELERVTHLLERTSENVGRFCRDLEFANAKLKALSITDSLTGLKNHREFQERIEDEVQRAKRYRLPLSLIMLDVDHFKCFNDAYGHPAGDDILKGLAKVLERLARETDTIARYGGEEFAIILANTDRDHALAAAERFRAAIAEEAWPHRRITVSMGVSTLTDAVKSSSDLIGDADKALYASKSSGRNCISHYDDSQKDGPE